MKGTPENTKDERDGETPGESSKRPWPPLIKVDEVVKTKIEKLLALQPEPPFGFGHSSFGIYSHVTAIRHGWDAL